VLELQKEAVAHIHVQKLIDTGQAPNAWPASAADAPSDDGELGMVACGIGTERQHAITEQPQRAVWCSGQTGLAPARQEHRDPQYHLGHGDIGEYKIPVTWSFNPACAADEGIDINAYGQADLCYRLGGCRQFEVLTVRAAVYQIAEACEAHGKLARLSRGRRCAMIRTGAIRPRDGRCAWDGDGVPPTIR
jgi:hypothetical protein